MTLIRRFLVTLAAVALFSSPALALKITNNDADAYKVTIVSGDKETEHELAAGASIEDGCEDGCTIRLAGQDGEVKAEKDDVLVIKDGEVDKAE